jgi:hypothetical protein
LILFLFWVGGKFHPLDFEIDSELETGLIPGMRRACGGARIDRGVLSYAEVKAFFLWADKGVSYLPSLSPPAAPPLSSLATERYSGEEIYERASPKFADVDLNQWRRFIREQIG